MHRIRSLLARRQAEDELQREIDLHVEQLTKQYTSEGMSDSEARLLARREFGSVDVTKEECRDTRRVNLLDDLAKDLTYAFRLLRKSPGFTLTAVLSLALGIGAHTAVFSAIYSVLIRPLPFKDPGRLVLVTEYSPGDVPQTGSPLLRFQARAAQNTVFEETAAYWNVTGGNGMVFGGSGSAERLQFSIVTNSFFSILGVQPTIGRTFSQPDQNPGGAKVFLASDALWRRLLGGDPRTIGKNFRLDGETYTLIGILPPEFKFPGTCDLWIPTGALGTWPLHDRVSHQFWMLGRLRPHIPLSQAQAEMDAIQHRLAQAYPSTDANWRVNVRPLLDQFVGNVRTSLWVLFGAVGFVLLIVCTNVVNLLLARAVAREKEFAVRTALGAARLRLLRQTLTETLLIVASGTALALIVAKAGTSALLALSSGSIPRFEQPHLSTAVLGFSAGLALLTTLLVGVASGLHASGFGFSRSLGEGQRGGFTGPRSTGLRNVLVISEIALTLLLLSGAGLMLRSFQQLRRVDPGFRSDQLISLKIALPDALYPKAKQRQAFLDQLLQKLNSVLGMESAAATDRLPLSGETNWGRINIVGRPLLDSAHAASVEGRGVSANYFRTLGIPLLRGREFTEHDVAQGRRVTVINQEMADEFWPGADPIGQRVVSAYEPGNSSEIIGIVGSVKEFALDAQAPPEMYSPYGWWNTMNLVFRGHIDPAALVSGVRSQVAAMDPEVPVYGITRMDELVGRSLARQRFELLLLALFAVIALALAAAGIYGLLAFTVSRRTQEIGLRMAVGANRRDVLALVMSQGMKLVLLGLGVGIAGSFALMSLMRGLLYRVNPFDPFSLAAVTVGLALTGALACWIPARRAMRVDPMTALRCE